MANKRLYDAIVVGAGLAGLSAAYQLSVAGRSTLVLEADKHIGGRILTKRIAGTTIEQGAQWISSSHLQFIELSMSLGLELEQHEYPGSHRFALQGVVNEFDGTLPKLSLADRFTIGRLAKNLDKATRRIDREKPWLSPQANELDQLRFSQYLKNNLFNKRHYNVIKTVLEGHFLNGIDQISALQGIMEWQEKDNEKWQILGGADQLPRKLAQEVDVLLGQKVKQVNKDGSFAKVECGDHSYRARHVIVALPPAQAAEISYDPPISTTKKSMWDSIKPGRIIKSTLVFPSPFWRSASWSGKAFIAGEGPFQLLIDAGTSRDVHGIISTYTIGTNCLTFEKLQDDEKKQFILELVQSILKCGPDELPLFSSMYDWKCPPNGYGAYHIFPPGILTGFEDHLVRPEGVIHWASAEYDPIYRGTMEGAVRSGLRAAGEILSL
ncbi:MAG: FAD-dependent oxidoreductase [Saprospiraceae bacterium]|nr:FAD-dependent oxidoreductase [Saprospiraceae bacterium]